MNQYTTILDWMRKRPITAMAGFDSLGIVNLSGRISELRQRGYEIKNVWRTANNRQGKPTRFVQYVLVKEPKI